MGSIEIFFIYFLKTDGISSTVKIVTYVCQFTGLSVSYLLLKRFTVCISTNMNNLNYLISNERGSIGKIIVPIPTPILYQLRKCDHLTDLAPFKTSRHVPGTFEIQF